MPRRPLVIVAAVARNGAIGRDNELPWTMPGDLARFRRLTMGRPMIMGRRTWDALGRNLPGRESIVVSHAAPADLPEGVRFVDDPSKALALADERAEAMGAGDMALIGGATLFAALMPAVDRLAMTFIDLRPEADTFFPAIDPYEWREAGRTVPLRDERDEAACTFVDYTRVEPSGDATPRG